MSFLFARSGAFLLAFCISIPLTVFGTILDRPASGMVEWFRCGEGPRTLAGKKQFIAAKVHSVTTEKGFAILGFALLKSFAMDRRPGLRGLFWEMKARKSNALLES